mgnify:CR=1 FL=1
MLKNFVLMAFVLLYSSSGFSDSDGLGYEYKEVGATGKSHFIHFDAEKLISRDDFSRVGKFICRKSNMCIVMFWDDMALVPKFMPMTDAQVNAKKAHYLINRRTKYEMLNLCSDDGC